MHDGRAPVPRTVEAKELPDGEIVLAEREAEALLAGPSLTFIRCSAAEEVLVEARQGEEGVADAGLGEGDLHDGPVPQLLLERGG